MNLSEVCTRIIRVSYYLLFALIPLILTPWNYELFEFNKMMVTYAVSVVVFTAWSVKMIQEREFRVAKTPLDIPILIFFFSQLTSSLFSIDPHVSWFGYYSRFNGGMWSVISYIILYYAFVTHFFTSSAPANTKQQVPAKQVPGLQPDFRSVLPLLYTALATAFLVSFYGILESYGIDKNLWVQDVQHRVFSTLGQPNWLSAYLVALLPLSMWLAWQSTASSGDKRTSALYAFLTPGFLIWSAVSAIFFWTLLLTRSRSGYFGFLAADAVLVSILGFRNLITNRSSSFLRWAIILHILFFYTVFVTGTRVEKVDSWITYQGLIQKFSPVQSPPAPDTVHQTVPSETRLMDVGISESTDIRTHVWNAAIYAWQSSAKTFLMGTGTETFAFAFYQFRPKEHNMTSEWDFLYNKAHNEYLNFLATTGLFGLASYLCILIGFCIWFIRTQISLYWKLTGQPSAKSDSQDADSRLEGLQAALFAGWVSILVTNFFGFSVVIMQLFLFLFPALIFALRRPTNGDTSVTLKLGFVRGYETPASLGVATLGIIICINLAFGWWADVVFASGYRANRSENYSVSEPLLSLATTLRPHEPLFQDELATALAGRATQAVVDKDNSAAADFAKRAISASDKAVTTSPHNVNFWKTRTKLFYSLSAYDPQLLEPAITSLEEAHRLSPNDVKIMYNLAILYGRSAQVVKAITMLTEAIPLKPDYRDLYYGLYVMYSETGKTAEAKAVAQSYLQKVDPGDSEFKKYAAGE